MPSRNIDFPAVLKHEGLPKRQQADPGHVWAAGTLKEAHHRRCHIPKGLSWNPRNSRSQRNRCLILPCIGVPSSPAQLPKQRIPPVSQWTSDLPKAAVGMGPISFPFIYFPLGWLTFPNENTSIKADLIMLVASDSPSPQSGCTRINLSSPIP